MKRFTFELVVDEGSDEFWDELKDMTVEQMLQEVCTGLSDALYAEGWSGIKLQAKNFEWSNDY